MTKQIFCIVMIIDTDSDEVVITRIAHSKNEGLKACIDLMYMAKETNIREGRDVWEMCYCLRNGLCAVDKLELKGRRL